MGEQFVTGETIEEALEHAKPFEHKGFRYSYDMLGEAALTDHDAERYYNDYTQAIHAIGKASNGRGVYEGPGISIKLSALHPRFTMHSDTSHQLGAHLDFVLYSMFLDHSLIQHSFPKR
jgi:RHH-type proline utilization regulon transcriptional repressor/proline dehydrogenase/delta 1-pyrroline-5-carboxylate dehydrogenase